MLTKFQVLHHSCTKHQIFIIKDKYSCAVAHFFPNIVYVPKLAELVSSVDTDQTFEWSVQSLREGLIVLSINRTEETYREIGQGLSLD